MSFELFATFRPPVGECSGSFRGVLTIVVRGFSGVFALFDRPPTPLFGCRRCSARLFQCFRTVKRLSVTIAVTIRRLFQALLVVAADHSPPLRSTSHPDQSGWLVLVRDGSARATACGIGFPVSRRNLNKYQL